MKHLRAINVNESRWSGNVFVEVWKRKKVKKSEKSGCSEGPDSLGGSFIGIRSLAFLVESWFRRSGQYRGLVKKVWAVRGAGSEGPGGTGGWS